MVKNCIFFIFEITVIDFSKTKILHAPKFGQDSLGVSANNYRNNLGRKPLAVFLDTELTR